MAKSSLSRQQECKLRKYNLDCMCDLQRSFAITIRYVLDKFISRLLFICVIIIKEYMYFGTYRFKSVNPLCGLTNVHYIMRLRVNPLCGLAMYITLCGCVVNPLCALA